MATCIRGMFSEHGKAAVSLVYSHMLDVANRFLKRFFFSFLMKVHVFIHIYMHTQREKSVQFIEFSLIEHICVANAQIKKQNTEATFESYFTRLSLLLS